MSAPMTWTDKVALLAEKDPASVAPFAGMDEETLIAHPFFGLLNSNWTNHIAAAKKTAVKKVMTPEEKLAHQQSKMKEYYNPLSIKTGTLLAEFKKTYDFLTEEELKTLGKKAMVVGLSVISEQMKKLSSEAPKAVKTLADGRKVANHNNYARLEDELVKNEDGTSKVVSVKFKNGKTEECGQIPTPGDDKMSKGWTFAELDGCKAVERAQKGHSQVFIKKMWFNSNPTHEEGKCKCAAKLNKKIQLHAMTESVDEDGMYHYEKANFSTIPTFACNNPISENGVCKAHNKTKDNAIWNEAMLNGWTPQQISQ